MTSYIFFGMIIGLLIVLTLFSMAAVIISVICYSKMVGVENSTHQVQYFDPFTDKDEEIEEDKPETTIDDSGNIDGELSDLDKLAELRRQKIEKLKFERQASTAFGAE